MLLKNLAPSRAYPIKIPSIEIQSNLDFLLLELPGRYLPMMPNGPGYVYNILKKCGIKFQALDLGIIFYHRYHSKRLLEGTNPIVTPTGYVMKEDPWDNANTDEWHRAEVIEYFWPQLEDIILKIVCSRPKIVGFSIHGTNRAVTKEFVKALRIRMPEVTVVVGGYDCVYHELGPWLSPDFDYMVIGEAEMTLGPLVTSLVKGERPKDLPGIISRFDSPDRKWADTPLLDDLDSIDFPKYEWTDLEIYQTPTGYHLVPILSSRGCHWSRCHFCSECFTFRKRSPQKVVDEIEYMVGKGLDLFHFNESDVNGDPKNLHDICSEIIRRGLKVRLVGQLRVHKMSTREYFGHLAKAGFVHLRFGVDGWSDRTLRLQRKGYNIKMAIQNLRDCRESGIYVTVNMIIGVPGETEEDIDEMIKNLSSCKDYIGHVEGINTLILGHGSEYFKNPDKYNIHFRGDRKEIYKRHLDFIPPALWYSEEPYIDQEIRLARVDKICMALYANGLNIGPFASRVLERLKMASTRTG